MSHSFPVLFLCLFALTLCRDGLSLIACRFNWKFYKIIINSHISAAMSSNTNTTKGECLAGQFRCANRLCVNSALLCDGRNDCGDFSDENKCSMSTIYFPQMPLIYSWCFVLFCFFRLRRQRMRAHQPVRPHLRRQAGRFRVPVQRRIQDQPQRPAPLR